MSEESMQRFDVYKADSKSYKPLIDLEKYIHAGTLGEDLIAIIKVRVSQINHCAYCLDMHAVEARKAGVLQRKLDVLAGWHEAAALFTERERSALKIAEQMTLISESGVSDETWQGVRANFDDREIAQLLLAVTAINTWNRLAVTTRQSLPE